MIPNLTMRTTRHAIFPLVILVSLVGCAAPGRGPAVPREIQNQAVVPGLTLAARTWGAALNPEFERELYKSVPRERETLQAAGHTGPLPPAYYLAISGGGSNGAYTAGLLNGWTSTGTRPDFKIVTGISTGALIAPFAFLGPEYDHVLKEVYTETTTADILTPRGFLAAIFDDALADNAPLWKMVRKYVNEDLMAAIAAEYARGRVLMIGTTNLDARRAVIWNIGLIASENTPEALALIQKIMIASASIPAAFPPMMLDVEVDGQAYQEMHVDGGAMTQVFLYPPSFKLSEVATAKGVIRDRQLYVIRNGRVDPDWAETERRTLSIAGRAVSSLLHTQGIGDLYRIYLNAQRDGIDFNLTFIPKSFTTESKEAFDRKYMNELYDVGYQRAVDGTLWTDYPPFFDE
jgi:predicted acylesterase/phospholipase RssA